MSVVCAGAVLSGLPAVAWADDGPTPEPTVTPTPTPTETSPPVEASLPKRLVIGESRNGTQIVARRQGDADAKRVLLVLGQMHGDEPYGRYVVKRLRKLKPRKDTAIWTIRTLNPDGEALRTRRNANRVDLNRNFPNKWRPGVPGSLFYSGPRPGSEPETQAFMNAARQIRPDAVVSYHQHAAVIDRGTRKKVRKWVRRLSTDLHLPISRVSCVTKCVGTLTGWFNDQFRGWAVTVELPRKVSVRRQKSMARAMVRLAPDLRPTVKNR